MKTSYAPQQTNSPFLYILLAFAFGVVFVCSLLLFAIFFPVPTPFQEFVFRVVLSLAAAGVAAVLPGILNIRINSFVTAGGSLAVFCVVFWFNPPQLVTPLKAAELSDRAKLAILTGNYGLAKSLIQKAIELNPAEPNYVHALAQIEYHLGNYSTAKHFYERAYDVSGNTGKTRDRSYLYTVSLIYEAQGKLDDAIANYEYIMVEVNKDTDIWKDVVFSQAQLHLKKALSSKFKHASLKAAEEKFRIFLESGGKPSHWARYHLACIHSTNAIYSTNKIDSEQLEALSLKELNNTLAEIKDFKGKTAKDHYEMLRHLIKPVSFYPWMPGYPVDCPPLRELIDKNPQNFTEL
ncbi:tetratricopeptide repeat protein [Ensifer aridi]|uniref:tetratricopeptide repeat protein n=1 Tax=Ensifer aridi TaxID=1708715 RepID=UPI0015E45E8A|nr:hypothetical protein [Ensifer aridi]